MPSEKKLISKEKESEEQKLSTRHKYLSKILSVSYNTPIPMEKAAFQYMYDSYGNTYLDAYNNIPHVGHSHPIVVEAGQRQMAQLNTNTRYLYDILPEYASKLLSKSSKLNKIFFVIQAAKPNILLYEWQKCIQDMKR